jgi:hypothetical protein
MRAGSFSSQEGALAPDHPSQSIWSKSVYRNWSILLVSNIIAAIAPAQGMRYQWGRNNQLAGQAVFLTKPFS